MGKKDPFYRPCPLMATDAIAQRRRHTRPAHQTYNKQPTLAEKKILPKLDFWGINGDKVHGKM
jgi:hypothetical protein